jgi:cobalamin-dependent methionine synthase I
MKNYNPAQEGMDAARKDAKARKFIEEITNEFQEFCLDSAGMRENHEDHLEFLQACMEVFVQMKIEENT